MAAPCGCRASWAWAMRWTSSSPAARSRRPRRFTSGWPIASSRTAMRGTRQVELARQLANFPQETMLSDRMNAYEQWNLPLPQALHLEWERSKHRIADGLEGATRFVGGQGRHGKF